MNRLPDYEQRSQLASQLASEASQKTFEEVSEILREGLKDSALGFLSLTKTATNDDTCRLSAIKHHLKLGGLETDRIEHGIVVKITSTQADKIEKVMSLMGDAT